MSRIFYLDRSPSAIFMKLNPQISGVLDEGEREFAQEALLTSRFAVTFPAVLDAVSTVSFSAGCLI